MSAVSVSNLTPVRIRLAVTLLIIGTLSLAFGSIDDDDGADLFSISQRELTEENDAEPSSSARVLTI